MFGIGWLEFAVIAVFAFLIFGPDKLPGVIKNVSHIWNQLKGLRQQADQVIKAEVVEPLKDIEASINPLVKDGVSASDKLASKLGLKPDAPKKDDKASKAEKDDATPIKSAASQDAPAVAGAAGASLAASVAAQSTDSDTEVKQTTSATNKETVSKTKGTQSTAGSKATQAKPKTEPKTISEPKVKAAPKAKTESFAEKKARLEQEHRSKQKAEPSAGTANTTPPKDQSNTSNSNETTGA